jgi:hypothetical protein
LKGFHEFHATRIEPMMAARAAEQVAAKKWALIAGPIGLVITGLVFWLCYSHFSFGLLTFMVTGVTGFLSLFTSLSKLWSLQRSVKSFMLREVCAFFGFEYQPIPPLSAIEEFQKSGLLPEYNKAKAEDRFHGVCNGVEFEFFECFLSVESRSDEDSRLEEVYHGVLFRLEFPKSFSGRTLVLKDEGRIGNFLKGRKMPLERIELEDPRFEKKFEVWGSDPIEARYLLTPTFMERLVELAKGFGSTRLECSFMESKLIISVHVSKNQFEAGGVFEDVKSNKRVETLIAEISRLFDIVETLKLNIQTRA